MKKFLLIAAMFAAVSASAQTVWPCEYTDAAVLSGTSTVATIKVNNLTYGAGIKAPEVMDSYKDANGTKVTFESLGQNNRIKWVPAWVDGTEGTPNDIDAAVAADQLISFKMEETDDTKYLSVGMIKLDATRIGTDAVRVNVKLIGEGDQGAYDSGWLITAENWEAVSEGIGSWNNNGYQPAREDCSKGTSHPTDGCSHLTIAAPADMPQDLYELTVQVVFYGIADNKGFALHNVSVYEAGADNISSTVVGAEVVATEYFTVAGQQIAAPVKGINLVKQTLANGAVKTVKVIF